MKHCFIKKIFQTLFSWQQKYCPLDSICSEMWFFFLVVKLENVSMVSAKSFSCHKTGKTLHLSPKGKGTICHLWSKYFFSEKFFLQAPTEWNERLSKTEIWASTFFPFLFSVFLSDFSLSLSLSSFFPSFSLSHVLFAALKWISHSPFSIPFKSNECLCKWRRERKTEKQSLSEVATHPPSHSKKPTANFVVRLKAEEEGRTPSFFVHFFFGLQIWLLQWRKTSSKQTHNQTWFPPFLHTFRMESKTTCK